MKIVSGKELRDMPPGTVWSYFEKDAFFKGLYLTSSLCSPEYNSIFRNELIGAVEADNTEELLDKIDRMLKGESVPVDFGGDHYCGSREDFGKGAYNPDQLYAVYEKEDVEKLIKRLQIKAS